MVKPEKLVIVSSKVNVLRDKDNFVNLNFNSDKSVLNFTCSITESYIQTYKVNDEILFQCRHNPENFDIFTTNMASKITEWSFVDH